MGEDSDGWRCQDWWGWKIKNLDEASEKEWWSLYDFKDGEAEVIGNVYENPELVANADERSRD